MSVLVYGAGGHANVVAEIAMLSGLHVAAYAVDPSYYEASTTRDGPSVICGDDDTLRDWMKAGVTDVALGVGDCRAREKIAERLAELKFNFPRLIHPSAIVSRSAVIGSGSVICAGAIVSSGARLGDGVIVNTGAIVDHDCEVWSWSRISPGARLAGAVNIGSGAWIGVGATISDHLRIGWRAIVGAGSTVIKDVSPGMIAYGCPAMERRPV